MTSNLSNASPITATSNSLTMTVNPLESPVVTATPTTVCAGTPSNLVGTASAGSIDWYTAATGGTLLTNKASGATYAVTPSVSTTYYAQMNVPTTTQTFNATGATQTFVVPAGVTSLTVTAAGAKGANFFVGVGGKGGTVNCTLNVTSGETLFLEVGNSNRYNGGGASSSRGGGGGGGSDIRRPANTIANRVVIAGGGGGGNEYNNGGGGGGLTGGTAQSGGTGGSQSTGGTPGGSLGSGGIGIGGGGGGYWGGGGGGIGGGGGGSSYTDPTLCSNVVHTQGNNAGNGYITLSWSVAACPSPTRTPVTVTVTPTVTPSVSIAANPSGAITAGTSVTFTATPTNGGTTPQYQWQKGGVNISGATAATYTSTTLANGDIITCVLTPSGEVCASPTTATSAGITMTVTTPAGAALNFDGTDDQVNVSGIDLSNKAYTIEFWAKPSGAITANRFVCGQGPAATGQGLHIGFIGDGTFFFSQYNDQLTVSGLYDANVWHHFACVNDPYSTSGKRRIIYRDGVEVGSDNSSQPFPTASGTFIIGTHPFGGDFFNGDIDEFRVWYRALAACEINNNKNCELPSGQTSLAAYYKFNQGASNVSNAAITSLTDASGNNLNGTFQNMALTGATSNFIATGGVTTGTTCTALPTPSVSIAANPSGAILTGTSVTFTATPTSGGTTPTYVWQRNGTAISGATAATYTSTTLANGDIITCVLTPSSEVCASPTTATSAGITMSVIFPCPSSTTLYVDSSKTTSGNGETWATAYKTLDEALFAAWQCPAITRVNVAKGTYIPNHKPYNMGTDQKGVEINWDYTQSKTFHIRTGLELQGGYPVGGGTRNLAANPTILTGLGLVYEDAILNAYHVVLMDASVNWTTSTNPTVLDGFVVTGGKGIPLGNIRVNGNVVLYSAGGGIYINGGTNTIKNCNIDGNRSYDYGGGIYAYQGNNTFSNNAISNNSIGGGDPSKGFGGGVYVASGTSAFVNNTIVGNTTDNDGGGVYALGTNTFTNNIFWANTKRRDETVVGADIYTGGTLSFTKNLLQLAATNYSSGNSNDLGTASGNLFAANPLLLDKANPAGEDGIWRTADDGLRLITGSPAVNAGTNTGVTATTDIAGATRIQGGTVDMGAYEGSVDYCPTTSTLYVDASKTAVGNGATWATAYNDLQKALKKARTCPNVTQIWVAKGTYYPTATIDRSISFSMVNNVSIIGGFAGTETALTQRVLKNNPTVLSGDIGTVGSNADNTYIIVNNINSDATAILDGFTITRSNNDNGFDPHGGGMFNDGASPTLRNVVFADNRAYLSNGPDFFGEGAGMYNQSSSAPTLTNVVFVNNTSGGRGTMLNDNYSIPTLNNVTFCNNTIPSNTGSAILCRTGSDAIVKNSILRGSFYTDGSNSVITYSNTEDGISGTGNINQDPLFFDATNPAGADGFYMTADDGLRLQSTSPSLNVGDNTGISSTDKDILGNLRIQTTTVDMGAYEGGVICSTSPILYVNTAITTSGNGETWATAYKDLQSALARARNCALVTQIWVAKGTYYPTATTDRSISFSMINNVSIIGGFAGTETALTQRVLKNNPTVLSGDIGTVGDSTDNTRIIVNNTNIGATATLDGFTITRANNNYGSAYGGGMFNSAASPTLKNIVFANNSVFEFFNGGHGPGMHNEANSAPILTNVVFVNNTTDGIGTMHSYASSPTLNNVTFYNNAAKDGTAIFSFGAESNIIIKNSIIRGSISNYDGPLVITYSNVEGGFTGTGNIDADPLFFDATNPAGADGLYMTADDGLRLRVSSPSLNTGDNTGISNTDKDILGNPRIQATTVDMGAYEGGVTITPSVLIASNIGSTVCAGTSVTFTATPTNGGTAPTYVWKKNGTAISGQTAATYTTTTLATGNTISCVMTSNDVAAAPTTATSNVLTMTVNPLESPIVTATPTMVCVGTPSNLVATASQGTIDWYDAATAGTLLTNTASAAAYAVTPSVSTTYYAQINPTVTQTFNATGATQTFVVPAGVTSLTVVAAGSASSYPEGNRQGGFVNTTLTVTPGETLTLEVGNLSGYNGGSANGRNLGSSGGGTDIRKSGATLANRVVVAGGAGGWERGGAGGGLIGGGGGGSFGSGGTQSAGGIGGSNGGLVGSDGTLGIGGSPDPSESGGGGGGGYYGGGGGGFATGGGGGSSYTDPTLCSNVVHTQGGNNGNGYITFAWTPITVCVSPTRVPVTVIVKPTVTPSVSIASNPSGAITTGTSVTFTATPTNGGTTPTYVWKKNGTAISGQTAATYTTTTLANADVVTCVLTPSSEICATATTATSNAVTMTVTPAVCDCDPACSPIPATAGTYTATRSVTSGGYTHYCSGNNLLLSINVQSGMTVPPAAVKMKIGVASTTFYPRWCGGVLAADKCFMTISTGNVLINRVWHIDAAMVTTTGLPISSTNPLQVKSYFTTTEFTALNTMLSNNGGSSLPDPTALKLYQPITNLGAFPDPNLIKPSTLSTIKYNNGTTLLGIGVWLHSTPNNGVNAAEYNLKSIINSVGIGKPF